MGSTKPTVSDGMSVSMDYTLKLDDGEVIDTSVGREPLEQGYRLEVGFEAPASVNAMAGQRLKVRIDD